jgi:N-acylneuraminate cytidylyltransferase
MICDAIVLARGGSKGIPRKNLVPVHGKPLIAWTIEAAQQAGFVRDVIVSTDSEEIAETARALGARVPMLRPDAFATDTSPAEASLRHALVHMCRDEKPDAVLFPQVTSPVRRRGTLANAFRHFADGNYDSLFSARLIRNYIWRNLPEPQPLYDPHNRLMRQQIPPDDRYYRETGNFYLFRTESFERTGCRLTGRISFYETSDEEVVEIDEPQDIAVAELMLERLERNLDVHPIQM